MQKLMQKIHSRIAFSNYDLKQSFANWLHDKGFVKISANWSYSDAELSPDLSLILNKIVFNVDMLETSMFLSL